jgi:peptidoglycan/LPS O-acetylase OafA/YrhL
VIFIALLVAFVVMGPFARIWATNEIWREKSYLGGMDAIAMGCLTALITHRLQSRSLDRPLDKRLLIALQLLGWLLILLILVWPSWHWLHPVMRFLYKSGTADTVLPLGACLIISASVIDKAEGSRWAAPIRWFGRHSYEVYMTHEFAIVALTALYVTHPRGSLFLWIALMLLCSAPLGWLVARYYSEPLNRALRPRL